MLILYFTAAASATGAIASLGLWLWMFREHSEIVMGSLGAAGWFLVPVLAGGAAGVWAKLLAHPEFGPARGAVVGFLAYLTATLALGIAAGTPVLVFAYWYFGFLLVGWESVLVGACIGWLYRKFHGGSRANKTLEPTP